MDTKQQLVENIKQWIKNDNEIRQLQAEVKKRKDNKKILSEKLVEVMRDNEIDEFDISDGKLVYSKKKVKAPLSRKHLVDSLMKFYENDKKMVEQISTHIMDTRTESVKETINRKINTQK